MPDLLDTNILSELRKPKPASAVLGYFIQHSADQRFISTVSLAEVRFGISIAQNPAQREDLRDWLDNTLRPLFQGQVLQLTEAILLRWRILLEAGRQVGRTHPQPDLFLAATALEHNLTLVTRNTRDFTSIPELKLFNPWNS